jgi:hypothetical protein
MFSGISKKQQLIRENRQNEQPRALAHQNRFPLAPLPEPPDLEVLPNAMNNHRFTLLFNCFLICLICF